MLGFQISAASTERRLLSAGFFVFRFFGSGLVYEAQVGGRGGEVAILISAEARSLW